MIFWLFSNLHNFFFKYRKNYVQFVVFSLALAKKTESKYMPP